MDDWDDITAIAAGGFHTVGLKRDDTVVAVGENYAGQCDVDDWRGIVAINVGRGATIGFIKNSLTNQDTEFEREFTEVLLRHQNILNDKRRFSALMKDIFPTKKAEVNTLALILELGIVDQIQESECIDTMYVFRVAKRLSSEYGTDSEFAKRMAQMWCTCYRRNILHKECNL